MEPRTVHETPSTRPRGPSRRSSRDRVLGGVGSSVAAYLGVPLAVARILLAASAFVGGLGVVIYAVLWLFVPDDQGRIVIHGQSSGTAESLLSALLSGVATLSLSAWITRDGPSWFAALLVVVGVVILSRRGEQSADGDDLPTGEAPDVPRPAPPFHEPIVEDGPPRTAPGPVDPSPRDPGPADPGLTAVLPVLVDDTTVYPRPPARGRTAPVETPVVAKEPKPAAFLGPLTVSIAVALAGSLSLLHAVGAIELQPSDVLIVVLAVVGLGLLVSTWFGRARGLILLGLVLVPAVVASAAVDRVDLRGGVGDRNWAPTSASELESTYRLGAGSMRLDLTGLDETTLDPADPVMRTQMSLGAGEVQVIVPETWGIDGVATVDLGSAWIFRDATLVAENSPLEGLGGGELRNDVSGAEDWFFATKEELRNGPGDSSHNVRSFSVQGADGAPRLDIDVTVTAGVVEVFRVAS